MPSNYHFKYDPEANKLEYKYEFENDAGISKWDNSDSKRESIEDKQYVNLQQSKIDSFKSTINEKKK